MVASYLLIMKKEADFLQREEPVSPTGRELATIALQSEPGNNYALGFAVILDWCEHDKWHVLIWTIAQQACSGRQ